MHDIAPIPYRESIGDEIKKGESLNEFPEVRGAADAYMGVVGAGALSNYNDIDRNITHYNGRDFDAAAKVIRGAALESIVNRGYESRG